MKLDKEAADLFFKLMWDVQFFVKEKLQLFPEMKDVESYVRSERENKLRVREELYNNIQFVDAFVEEKSGQYAQEELSIILGWKNFVKGEFYIERFLKTYAIFVHASNDTVYGVVGLHEGLDEMVDKSRLPMRISAVLLPFRDKIIYDGTFHGYNMYFGKNIRARLKEAYLAAKQSGEIITSLVEGESDSFEHSPVPVKNWKPELEQLVILADRLKGGGGQPPLNGPAFSLVKAGLDFANLAVAGTDDIDRLHKCLKKVERAMKQAQGVLYRMAE